MLKTNLTIRKKAFTLIETLLASLIAVVILGSAVLASRTTQAAALMRDQLSQMNTLMGDSLGYVEYLKEVNHGNFASSVGLLTETEVSGAFVLEPGDLNCGMSVCPAPALGGPMLVKWCAESDGGCNSISGPICLNQADTRCSLSSLGGVEYVAVKKEVQSGTWLVRSLSDPAMTQDLLYANLDSTDWQDWNFYTRSIKISKAFGNITYNQANNSSLLEQSSYYLTITITDVQNSDLVLTKTMLITDW